MRERDTDTDSGRGISRKQKFESHRFSSVPSIS